MFKYLCFDWYIVMVRREVEDLSRLRMCDEVLKVGVFK